jgi:hypothetical protein
LPIPKQQDKQQQKLTQPWPKKKAKAKTDAPVSFHSLQNLLQKHFIPFLVQIAFVLRLFSMRRLPGAVNHQRRRGRQDIINKPKGKANLEGKLKRKHQKLVRRQQATSVVSVSKRLQWCRRRLQRRKLEVTAVRLQASVCWVLRQKRTW